MPEWLKGADCKFAGLAYVGSNPTRPIIFIYLVLDKPIIKMKSNRFFYILNKLYL